MTTATCPRCGNDKHRGRCKQGGGDVKRQEKPAEDVVLVGVGPSLSIAPGLGLNAWIENDCLQVSQGDDVVALSRTEARVLFAQFDEWAQ